MSRFALNIAQKRLAAAARLRPDQQAAGRVATSGECFHINRVATATLAAWSLTTCNINEPIAAFR